MLSAFASKMSAIRSSVVVGAVGGKSGGSGVAGQGEIPMEVEPYDGSKGAMGNPGPSR